MFEPTKTFEPTKVVGSTIRLAVSSIKMNQHEPTKYGQTPHVSAKQLEDPSQLHTHGNFVSFVLVAFIHGWFL